MGHSKRFKNQFWSDRHRRYTNFSTKKGESPVLGGERQGDRDTSQHRRLPKGQHRRFKLVCLLYCLLILRSVSPFWFLTVLIPVQRQSADHSLAKILVQSLKTIYKNCLWIKIISCKPQLLLNWLSVLKCKLELIIQGKHT